MGENFSDIRKFGSARSEQNAGDLQIDASDDMEITLLHKFVNTVNSTAGGIVHRKHAVFTKSVSDRFADTGKVFEVHDIGDFEKFVAGDLSVGSFHSHTGDDGTFGELGRSIGANEIKFIAHTAVGGVLFTLIGAGKFHQSGEEVDGIFAEFIFAVVENTVKDLAFPLSVQNGRVGSLLQFSDFGDDIHAVVEQTQDLRINTVDPVTAFFDTHNILSPVSVDHLALHSL